MQPSQHSPSPSIKPPTSQKQPPHRGLHTTLRSAPLATTFPRARPTHDTTARTAHSNRHFQLRWPTRGAPGEPAAAGTSRSGRRSRRVTRWSSCPGPGARPRPTSRARSPPRPRRQWPPGLAPPSPRTLPGSSTAPAPAAEGPPRGAPSPSRPRPPRSSSWTGSWRNRCVRSRPLFYFMRQTKKIQSFFS